MTEPIEHEAVPGEVAEALPPVTDQIFTTLEDMIVSATEIMVEARVRYDAAVNSMKRLEAERGLLVGQGFDTGRAAGLIKKLMPLVLKYGGMFAGGGGLAALAADPGAFAGIFSKIGSIFGSG